MKIVNVEQAAGWDGAEGQFWAENAAFYEGSSIRYRERLLAAAGIRETDRVLDIGCGTGAVAREAARIATAGSVVGVDLSSPMLDHARKQAAAEGLTNVSFEQADAQVAVFGDPFDVAVSSFGVMFFNDPVAAFTNIRGALREGGRFAAIAWRAFEHNEWLHVFWDALSMGRSLPHPPPNVPSPVAFADGDRVRQILGDAGFGGVGLEIVNEPLIWGRDADDAFGFMRSLGIVRGLTQELDEAQREQALKNLRDAVVARETSDGVALAGSAWLITARA